MQHTASCYKLRITIVLEMFRIEYFGILMCVYVCLLLYLFVISIVNAFDLLRLYIHTISRPIFHYFPLLPVYRFFFALIYLVLFLYQIVY